MIVVVIVVFYWVLRVAATNCTGATCDWYIPFSLLLPLLAIALAAVAAGIAASQERARPGWRAVIAVCGVLTLIGPVVLALALKDNDTKVWISTVLVLSVPATILLSTAVRRTSIRG